MRYSVIPPALVGGSQAVAVADGEPSAVRSYCDTVTTGARCHADAESKSACRIAIGGRALTTQGTTADKAELVARLDALAAELAVLAGGAVVTLAGTGRVADDLFLMAHDEGSGRPFLARASELTDSMTSSLVSLLTVTG